MTRPITDTTPVDPDTMFRKYEAMLHRQARHFHNLNPSIELEEFVGAGHEAFCNCLARWEPDTAAFSTLFHRALRGAMLNVVKMTERRPQLVPTEDMTAQATLAPTQDEALWLQDLYEQLGKDARHVVALVLEGELPPTEKDTRLGVRRAVRQHLRQPNRRKPKKAVAVKWPYARINDAFSEITRALATC